MIKGGEFPPLLAGKFFKLLQEFPGGLAVPIAAKGIRILRPKAVGFKTMAAVKSVHGFVKVGMRLTRSVSFSNPVQ